MKVLVVGSGGREHALCWAIAASPLCTKLYCAPGNGGIAQEAECVAIAADDLDGIVGFCRDNHIDFVVVGPEQPLVLGLVDRLDAAGIKAFGPRAYAAVLEGSKGFTKDLCARYGMPTAAYGRFGDAAAAKAFVAEKGAPIVVKADGLAAGKGVIMAETDAEAIAAIDDIFGGRFGAAGAEVVIEEWLIGEEASFFALVDGEHALALATAQDHKRVGDGDTGPNTGGMGAYSPAPVMTRKVIDAVMETIIRPTVAAMNAEGRPFRGVLFAGLMITDNGPQLIEYNARFGDPECQVLMMRLKSDILPALIASADGQLANFDLRWRDEPALTVVMAANGYPGDYDKGTVIGGLDEAAKADGVQVFHAGTALRDGKVVATGGRVLGVTAMGTTIAEAQQRAYAAIDKLDWPEGFCRRDIGWRAVGR
ncbi:phosphoribosylamine--glycine ligase [Emcibacter sp. SYSU 3D8]|uniref:phosphoribosylamine--glycine ligase n=1 Tax=Emcibacter sp. SYSU 3D8 TaxID=3133969 RepID=UPI0031FE5DF8